jgi:hypothetical protein
MPLDRQQLVEIAHRHARVEGEGDIEAVMATLDPNPTYRFDPIGLGFSGTANARRFYEVFMSEVKPRLLRYSLDGEWIGDTGVAQEYSITASGPDDRETTHQVLGILTFGERGLSGERLYASEAFFRLLAGSMWDALESI